MAFDALKRFFIERDIVELTLFTCLFNAWNRFQDGLHNELESPEDQVQWRPWESVETASG